MLLIAGGMAMTTAGMGGWHGLSALAQMRGGVDATAAQSAPDLALAGADDLAQVRDAVHDAGRQAAPRQAPLARPEQRKSAADAAVRTPRLAAHRSLARRQHVAIHDRARQKITPGEFSMSLADPTQQQVLALVNQDRRSGGCDNVALDRRLIVSAYGHAADMARHGYFAHESPAGTGSSDRMWAAGFHWSRYGENIARGPDSVAEVVDGWMNSPAHRENIMDCRLQEMGIGVAVAWDGTPYWVQDFATPQ
jgi:uncharacterized protein YkwD